MISNDRFSVGQIVYVIMKKRPAVCPMQVVEEITKKTLNGEETTYLLQAGSDSSQTIHANKIEGEIFSSIDEVRQTLLQRVVNTVNSRINDALKKAEEWYSKPVVEPQHPDVQSESLISVHESDATYVEIPTPDGTIQKVKIRDIKLPASLK